MSDTGSRTELDQPGRRLAGEHAGSSDGAAPVAIVTGAAGAIGSAYAHGLAGAGYRVVLADLRQADDVAASVASQGPGAIAVRTDVSDPQSTAEMAAAALDAYGRIDVLVNNAAYFSDIVKRPLEQIPLEEWDLAFDVNVRGTWLCACAVLPAMKAQGSGRIVNISSSVTQGGGVDGFAHYASSKAAIAGLSRCMAWELARHGIRVNTISPDYVAHEGRLFAGQPGLEDVIAAQRAIKRPMRPEDLVGTLLYLVGDGSGFVTGQDFWVNGGRYFG